MLNFKSSLPLGLYIHIPWCIKKCPYCDFNSHTSDKALPEDLYTEALLQDLELELRKHNAVTVSSIFIGGGTPSLFQPESIDKLLTGLSRQLQFSRDIEITLEANPGAVEHGRFREFRASGINRLSIGVQSFDPQLLKNIGRIHDGNDAARAIEMARLADFNNINIDLMYGLPQQTVQQAIKDLNTAIAAQTTHISHYQLTIEPNTAFYNRRPALPADERIWNMQQECQQLLHEAGFIHYEVSAYSRPEHKCRHNLNYWEFGDYLGIGAGAHQKLSSKTQQSVIRSQKQRLPQKYMQLTKTGLHIEDSHSVDHNSLPFEFMLNALRLNDGFDTELFTQRTGLPVSTIEKNLNIAKDKGLIDYNNKYIRPSRQGRLFLNELLMLFME